MPLVPGSSRQAISSNISELTHHGTRPRSHDQIVAIALSNARRHPRAEGGAADDRSDANLSTATANARQILREPEGSDLKLNPLEALATSFRLRGELAAKGLKGFKSGGAIAGNAIDRAVSSASRAARKHLRQHFEVGGLPQMPYFERQEARDVSNVHPGGLVNSTVPGRTDMHNINVAAGSYVLPADVVSGLGEGNTLAGAKVTDQMLSSGPYGIRMPSIRHGGGYGAIPHPPAPFRDEAPSAVRPSIASTAARGGTQRGIGKAIPIVVAGGEYIVNPDQVLRRGGGDIDAGHRWLDNFVLHVRKKTAKTLRKLPGPVK